MWFYLATSPPVILSEPHPPVSPFPGEGGRKRERGGSPSLTPRLLNNIILTMMKICTKLSINE